MSSPETEGLDCLSDLVQLVKDRVLHLPFKQLMEFDDALVQASKDVKKQMEETDHV